MNVSPAWRKCFRAIPESKAIVLLLLVVPAVAHAQAGGASPFDTGFSAMQNLFTGTVAKVASLIAIVVGGYQFAHGEPGAKKISNLSHPSRPVRGHSGPFIINPFGGRLWISHFD